MRMDTQAVHGGRNGLGDAHVPPIDLSTTYRTSDLDAATHSIDTMAEGGEPAGTKVYQRLYNPTVARFEAALAGLEGTEHAVAFASGMASVTASLLAARLVGSHVVAVRPLYGGTDHLLTSGLLALDVSWATPETVGDFIRDDTALVLCETPANPTLQLVDIAHVVAQAKGVAVLVDSTFATPILQRPSDHGAALTLHSGTKFLGGHGDVMAGVVACDEVWARRLRQVRILTGGNLHPMAAYTLHRGLQTLGVRVRAAQENARKLARLLLEHPAVDRVLYPESPGGDPLGLLGRQLKGPGSIIGVDLKGGYEAARRVMSNVSLITPAVSLGSCDTLIQHPVGLTHRIVEPEALKGGGIGPGLLRISVGIEDVSDLWKDLEVALSGRVKRIKRTAYARSA
jgi:methionine-gamma-lyase